MYENPPCPCGNNGICRALTEEWPDTLRSLRSQKKYIARIGAKAWFVNCPAYIALGKKRLPK